MRTALVIIDAQTSLIAEGAWKADVILATIRALLQRARGADALVVFVVDRRVTPDGSIHSSLEVRPSDPVVSKGFSDSFIDTELAALLQARGAQRLVIAGLQTDYCIDTSCRRAASLGYEVVLASDAHTTFDHEFLTAEQIVAHHNHILRAFQAGSGRIHAVASERITFE